MNDDLKAAVARIGQAAVWVGGAIAAPVTVSDVKQAYGHLRYKVRDCRGAETWVQSENLKFE